MTSEMMNDTLGECLRTL